MEKKNLIRAELIKRGIRLSDIARMCNTSRQQVSIAISKSVIKYGKQLEIRNKIKELIGL